MSYIKEALQGIRQLPSPNIVQELVIGRDFVYARFHMPIQGKNPYSYHSMLTKYN